MGTNHNQLAEVLVAVVPVGYYLMKTEKDFFFRHVYQMITLGIATVGFLTLSRSGWLALMAAAVVIVGIEYREVIREKFQKVFWTVLGVLVLPVSMLLYLINTSAVAQSSNVSRVRMIEASLEMWKTHPWIGVGAGTFQENLNAIKFFVVEFGEALDSHSLFFKVLTENGVLGVVFFFAFVGLLVWKMYAAALSHKDEEMVLMITVLLASSLGAFVFQNFGTAYYSPRMWLWFGLGLAAVEISKRKLKLV
jgi:O-antigen ligase